MKLTREQILELADSVELFVASDNELIAFFHAAIESYKAELLKEVGEPVAAISSEGGNFPKLNWKSTDAVNYAAMKQINSDLFTSDQVAAAILKATKPLEEEIERWKNGGYTNLWKQRTEDREAVIERQRLTLLELRDQLAAAQEEINRLQKDTEAYGPEKLSIQKQAWLEADRQRQINDLRDQLAKAEQRVAEACAAYCDTIEYTGYTSPEDGGAANYYDECAVDIADALRFGEWRKFLKEV